ncbi:glycosyltransferase [Sphingobium aquiterrae]|uniref:glycosyltransferase n=1 Tax=Sphingobium aquiterrae TaxID=2038656 RepID=UPI0030189799
MRILTFLHSFEPGGVERIALRLIRQWRAEGVDAPLFMGRASGAMARDVGRDLAYVEPRRPPFAIGWMETLWMIATLPRAIRRLKPDVLFCAGNSYAVVAVAMKLILGRRCPPILAKISNDLDRRDMPWPARQCYRLWLRVQGRTIDHFVGMEAPMAGEIAQTVRPRRPAAIIPDPALSLAQIDRLRATARPPRKAAAGRRFVAIGRLAPQKNFPLMLHAFAYGAQADDTLTIFGEGPKRPALEKLVRSVGMEGRIFLPGHVAEPADALPGYDIFLLSSDYEGVPAVVLEALAAGLTIIATRCSRSMGALLLEGALGQLLPMGNGAAFAQAIAGARPDSQDMVASLAQARRFAVEQAAHDYIQCLEHLANETAATGLFFKPTEAGT